MDLHEGYGIGLEGDVRDQPEHWLNVINLDPTKGNLQQLAQELSTRPVGWIDEYIELRGVVALMDLLELLEKRTSKRASDFAVMDQVLRCLRSLMNLERGMRVILGLDEMMDAAVGSPRRGGSTKLQQLVNVLGAQHSLSAAKEARAVQCQALTLLSAAALFSTEGHEQAGARRRRPHAPLPPAAPSYRPSPHRACALSQVLAAFDRLRKTRRGKQRFGWALDRRRRRQPWLVVCGVGR